MSKYLQSNSDVGCFMLGRFVNPPLSQTSINHEHTMDASFTQPSIMSLTFIHP